jgi:hypothetical protein
LLGKTGHEPLKRRPELLWIEHTEKPAERVMAGHAIFELEKPAQERLLRLREQAHVHRALPAAQNRAHRYRQNLMKAVQRGIAGARVVQTNLFAPPRKKKVICSASRSLPAAKTQCRRTIPQLA